MPLQLDIHIRSPKQADEAIEQAAHAISATHQGRASGQRHQTARVAFEILERERAFTFRRTQLHAGKNTTEIAVPFPRFNEDGQAPHSRG